MRRALLVIATLMAVIVSTRSSSAQNLTFSLLERYLESAREQAGIPGMSAAVVRDGSIAWERGFGRQDVEAGLAATPDTVYLIGELSQIFGATLLMKECYDESSLEIGDRVVRWASDYPESSTTIGDLLSHTAPEGGYRYAPGRFAALTRVIEQCASAAYPRLLAEELFARASMSTSAPGSANTPTAQPSLSSTSLQQLNESLRSLARPYRHAADRPVRSDVPSTVADAASGAMASVRDLARFDSALDRGSLLSSSAIAQLWTQARSGNAALPTGHGWFVQNYSGETVVWQFGQHRDAYSSLILKLPNRRLTFLLLANSDGLTAPFSLDKGDINTSVFARIFLRLFVS